MRFYVAVIHVSLTAALLVCSGCGAAPGSTEAERFAKKYWDERLTKCGDTYLAHNLSPNFTTPEFAIIEYTRVSVWVNPVELSEADKLNGFEWSGGTGFWYTSMRFKPNGKAKMSDWIDGATLGRPQASQGGPNMWKKKGEDWQVGPLKGYKLEIHPGCELLK
jgi:hypothetical protein